jgi:hypothetical protein
LAEEVEREEVMRVYLLAPANNGGSIASAAYVTEAPPARKTIERRQRSKSLLQRKAFAQETQNSSPPAKDPAKRLSESY